MSVVEVDQRGRILVVEINRPDKRNALNAAFWRLGSSGRGVIKRCTE